MTFTLFAGFFFFSLASVVLWYKWTQFGLDIYISPSYSVRGWFVNAYSRPAFFHSITLAHREAKNPFFFLLLGRRCCFCCYSLFFSIPNNMHDAVYTLPNALFCASHMLVLTTSMSEERKISTHAYHHHFFFFFFFVFLSDLYRFGKFLFLLFIRTIDKLIID